MGKRLWVCFGTSALILGSGCNRQDTDHLAEIGKILAHKTNVLTSQAQEDLRRKWEGLHRVHDNSMLARRVATRIQYDKQLENISISVKSEGEIIELSGMVQDDQQRQRAVDLARTTVGVEQVKDEMKIGPNSN